MCRGGDGPPKWYKFDDGDVSECKMDDDEVSFYSCNVSCEQLSDVSLKHWYTSFLPMHGFASFLLGCLVFAPVDNHSLLTWGKTACYGHQPLHGDT